jgi:hypothetical protein
LQGLKLSFADTEHLMNRSIEHFHLDSDRPSPAIQTSPWYHRLVALKIPAKIVLEPGENRDRQLRRGMNVAPNVYLR